MAGGGDTGDPKKGSIYVNVIPMIDLLLMLLIFLLTNFASSVFEDAAAINAGMPVFGPSNPEEQEEPDPAAIKSLRIKMLKDSGFVVTVETGLGTTLQEVALRPDQTYDFDQLTNVLSEVKEQYQEHEDALIEVERDTKYSDVIHAMDAVRERVSGIGSAQIVRLPLFPSISLTDTGQTS